MCACQFTDFFKWVIEPKRMCYDSVTGTYPLWPPSGLSNKDDLSILDCLFKNELQLGRGEKFLVYVPVVLPGITKKAKAAAPPQVEKVCDPP